MPIKSPSNHQTPSYSPNHTFSRSYDHTSSRSRTSSQDFSTVIQYMKSHWPSQAKPEWQVTIEEYPALLEQVIADFTAGATKHHQMIRIAGISGSGKTTQLLPATEAYCNKHHLKPILVAARRFVEYHPHYQAILDHYGAENLRKMTDEFSTIMMFLTLARLTAAGYDIILDVTLLDPEIEAILLKFLTNANYQLLILMVATSPTVTAHFLAGRSWRHTPETEAEFIRATKLALSFYAQSAPDTRIIIWSVYNEPPEYDGPIKSALPTFTKFSSLTTLPKKDDNARKTAKINYLCQA